MGGRGALQIILPIIPPNYAAPALNKRVGNENY